VRQLLSRIEQLDLNKVGLATETTGGE